MKVVQLLLLRALAMNDTNSTAPEAQMIESTTMTERLIILFFYFGILVAIGAALLVAVRRGSMRENGPVAAEEVTIFEVGASDNAEMEKSQYVSATKASDHTPVSIQSSASASRMKSVINRLISEDKRKEDPKEFLSAV